MLNLGDKKRGDQLAADDVNRLTRALRALEYAPHAVSNRAGAARGVEPTRSVCYALNSHPGVVFAPGDCVYIQGQAYTSEKQDVCLVVIPYVGGSPDKLAFAVDVIRPGEVGRVCYAGILWVKGLVGFDGHYAEPVEGSNSLRQSASGPVQVLATDVSAQRYLIRFPVGSVASEAPATTFTFTVGDW